MQQLDITLEDNNNQTSRDFILNNAGDPDIQRTNVSIVN